MGYRTFPIADNYGPRRGLEGPFRYPSGMVLYYDPIEGAYWNPQTDFYVPHEEVSLLQDSIFDTVRG